MGKLKEGGEKVKNSDLGTEKRKGSHYIHRE